MSPTMPILRCGALAGLALCLVAGSAQAARIALPFARTDLNGGSAGTSAPIVLPATVAVRRAQLVVAYANALAVEPDGSGLVVGLNGEPLVELPLVATQGTISADIDIPARLLAAGTNSLTLRARQRHRVGCDRAAFSELWTRLDAAGSYLELDLAPRPGMVTLRHLEGLLASSLYDGEAVTVATARAASDPAVLEWGGMAAEAVALRRGQRPLAIRHARLAGTVAWSTLRGQNFVVIGSLAELADAVPPGLSEEAGDGLIAIRPLPADPLHFAVVLSGRSDAAVARALAAFRRVGRTWPDVAALTLHGGEAPLPADAGASAAVTGGGSLTLAELGYATQDLPLSFTETLEVELDLAEDYYAGNGQQLELALDYAYGAGLAPTSALIIRVNDLPWNMVRLDRDSGDIVSGMRVELPMGMFNPGRNRIAFQPLLHPADAETCRAIGDQPMFTLFDDSEIAVPRFARLARQPDLRLFADRGFPYALPEQGTTLLVAGSDPATVTAAWTLRGKLAQRHGTVLQNVTTTTRLAATGQHVLVIGPHAALPEAIVAASPLPLRIGYRATATAAPPPAAGAPAVGDEVAGTTTGRARDHWAQRLTVNHDGEGASFFDVAAEWLISMARAVPYQAPATGPSFEELAALEADGDAGTIVAFRSPYAADRTATVITAASAATLGEATLRLIETATWQRLAGDVSLWQVGSDRVLSRRLAEPYLIEEVDSSIGQLWLLWRTYMAQHPSWWLALVFALVVCLTTVTGALLRRRASA